MRYRGVWEQLHVVHRKKSARPQLVQPATLCGMRPSGDQAATRRLYNVTEAAEVLGLTVEAVRSRIKRGTLEKEKDDDGTVYVVVEDSGRPGTDQARPGDAQSNDQATAHPLIIDRLENEVDWLRREVERKDTIIMSLSQSIAALEAPREPSESPVTTSAGGSSTSTTPPEQQEGSERRSWWRRL